MSSIPLPALAVKPPEQQDPVGQYAKGVALQGLLANQQQQQQMRPLQMQQAQGALQQQQIEAQNAQQAQQDSKAVTAAMAADDFNWKDPIQAAHSVINKGGSAKAAEGVYQSIISNSLKLAEQAKNNSQTFEAQTNAQVKQGEILGGKINSVLGYPDAQLPQALIDESKELDPQHAQVATQLSQALQQGQITPADARLKLKALANSLTTYSEQVKQAQEQMKAENSAKNKSLPQLEYEAAGGDAQAKEALRLNTHQQLAGRTVVNNMIPGVPTNPAGGQPATTGQAYLDTLPAGYKEQVIGIIEGRSTMPRADTRSQAGQQLRLSVFRGDPNFNEQRAKVRNTFATDKNITNLNTATVHADALGELATALDNGDLQPGNELYNRASTILGAPAPTNYEGLRQALAGELDQALHGTSTIEGRKAIADTMPVKASKGQMAGIVDTQLKTIAQKLETYHQRYQQVNPDDTVWSPVVPQAQKVLQKHGLWQGSNVGTSSVGTQSFTDPAHPGKVYHIPADQVEEFKRDHPNAR